MNNMLNLSELRSVVDEAKAEKRLICLAPDTVEFLLNLAEMAYENPESENS
jgi:hypothetical protein